jgi:spermidine synthase
VPLYETTEDVVKSELATFFQVFPQGVVWGNTKDGQGYDLVLSATQGIGGVDIDALAERVDRFDHARVAESLSQVGYASVLGLLSTYSGTAQDLQGWLAGSEINRDRNLRLMFQAGLQLNQYQQSTIYRDILEQARFPTNLFSGSPQNLALLRAYLGME